MAHTYSHLYNIETIGLRFFTVYGPWGRPDMAMFLFTDAIINNNPIKVFNEGTLSRDFTYIDNVIQANLLSLVTNNKKAINTVYNVAFGDRNTLNDLMGYLKEYLSEFDSKISNIEVIYGPNRVGDIPHSHASVDKAKEILNYNPQFSLQQGLKVAVKWYWENL